VQVALVELLNRYWHSMVLTQYFSTITSTWRWRFLFLLEHQLVVQAAVQVEIPQTALSWCTGTANQGFAGANNC
jgi:hypothetical protein